MKKMRNVALAIGLLMLITSVAAIAAAPETPIDINQASVSELMTIPGIGAAKAQAIVDYRTHVPFKSVEDLLNVKGIGEKLLAKIKPYITVKTPSAAVQQKG